MVFPELLCGGGQTGQLLRTKDWSITELGAIETWPASLVNVTCLILNSRFPLIIFWGAKLNVIFNDAYVSSTSTMDLAKLGKPGLEVWPEVWHLINPMLRLVFAGKPICSDDQKQIINRSGFEEECYFMWSYSPVRDENGSIQGALAMFTETTARVIGERRLSCLSMLSFLSQDVSSVVEACARVVRVIHEHDTDIAFALIYLCDSNELKLNLQDIACIQKSSPAAIQEISLIDQNSNPATPVWPAAKAFMERRFIFVPNPESMFGPLPGGASSDSPKVATVCPIMASSQQTPAGVLIIGVNPRRTIDEDYQVFIDLLTRQIAHNLSTAKTRETERKRSQSSSERLQTAFFSNISQELRTPLTLILGPLEHVLTDPEHVLHAEYKDRLALVHRNAARLLKLVNSLLDFSRIEAGRMNTEFIGVKLGRLTANLASMFRSGFETAGLSYIVDTECMQETVFVDLDMWEKVVFNLLSNAFKYTLTGQISVSMVVDSKLANVEFSVSDTGCGITDADLPHIFERFYVVSRPNTRSCSGSGIGLALSQEIIKMHGGNITVQTVVDQGSTFTVTLPLGTDHLPVERVNMSSATDEATSVVYHNFAEQAWQLLRESNTTVFQRKPSDPKRPRVLVVSQNTDMQQYMSDLLSGMYDVDVANDGRDALEHVAETIPDLVVADAVMPRLGGPGLIKALRNSSKSKGIPLILMSSSIEEDARVEGLQAGADDYLVTPFTTSELMSRVKTQLQISGLRSEVDRLVMQRSSASLASEKRYRTLVQHSPVGTFLTNNEGHVLFFNDMWAQVTHIESLADADNWQTRVHKDDKEAVALAWNASIDNRAPFQIEFKYWRDHGPLEWIWIFAQSTPDADEIGSVRGFVVSFTDMTERKRDEEERIQLLRHAEELQRVRAEEADENRRVQELFVDTICHEIRNPLNGMINNVDLLRDNLNTRRETLHAHNETTQKLVTQVSDDESLLAVLDLCMSHQKRITNDVLNLSKLQADNFTLNVETFCPSTLIQGVVSMTQAQTSSNNIDLSLVLPETEMRSLRADTHRISQVIINLLSNAIKFTAQCPLPKIKVTASLLPIDGDNNHVLLEVSVADTGVGMTTEEQAMLFQRFAQANMKTYSRYGGTGLGLYLSKIIVERMGGHIYLTSKLNEGTTVSFTVRCELASSSHDSLHDDLQASLKINSPKIDNKDAVVAPIISQPTIRVLIVEDNDINQAVLKRQLESAIGFKCLTQVVENGLEAVRFLERESVDVVLMDIEMPMMNGLEATKIIRQREKDQNLPHVAVIGLSGNARKAHVDLALASGMSDYIVKPYNKQQLLAKVFALAPESV